MAFNPALGSVLAFVFVFVSGLCFFARCVLGERSTRLHAKAEYKAVSERSRRTRETAGYRALVRVEMAVVRWQLCKSALLHNVNAFDAITTAVDAYKYACTRINVAASSFGFELAEHYNTHFRNTGRVLQGAFPDLVYEVARYSCEQPKKVQRFRETLTNQWRIRQSDVDALIAELETTSYSIAPSDRTFDILARHIDAKVTEQLNS